MKKEPCADSDVHRQLDKKRWEDKNEEKTTLCEILSTSHVPSLLALLTQALFYSFLLLPTLQN